MFGLLPRASVAGAWTALGLVVVINLFGQVLQLSHWVLDLSPFTHAPAAAGRHGVGRPAAVAVRPRAGGLSVAGLAGLRRRDIG